MSNEQKLKQSIQSQSRQISKETAQNLNLEIDSDAVELIAELCWKKLLNYGSDLEAFQSHAKRSTITVDDVKLLVRNNESLKELVDTKVQAMKENKGASTSGGNPGGERKRKN